LKKKQAMKRKDFLLTGFAALPMLAFAQAAKADNASKKSFVVPAGKARTDETIKFLGVHPNDVKISGKDTGGQLAVFEYTGLAKVGPSLHLHFDQDETFYIIEGEYRFVVGDETYLLKAGDTIFLPRNVPHSWIQLTEKGKMTYLLQPAGRMEEFFRLMNSLKSRPSAEEMNKIHKKHGMKVLGPPLSL
jgi:quercetin dioxygenase-like cupin family protein